MTAISASPPSRRETLRQIRRETIVQVASQYFIEHGYAGTAMSGVANALGGSKGTLWSYFPSKEALFVAVFDRLTEDFREQLSRILASQSDFETTLRSFCRKLVEKVTAPESLALYRLVVAESPRFPEIGRLFHDSGIRRTQRELGDYLRVAVERGLVRCDDPELAARQLMALCLTDSRQQVLMGLASSVAPEDIEANVSQSMDMFLRAYPASDVSAATQPLGESVESPA